MNSGTVSYRPFDESSPNRKAADPSRQFEGGGAATVAGEPNPLPPSGEKLSVAEVMRDQADLLAHYQV